MKAHVIKHMVNGMTYTEACPYCGHYSPEVEGYPKHMQEKHPLVGYEWKLREVRPLLNANDKYWIMQTEFKHGK